MAKQTSWSFTVAGSGKFPLDMLRYDGAFPWQSVDSQLIEDTLTGRYHRAATVTVRLVSNTHAPTVARWQSYGWLVSDTR